ncbi:WXG100 family type VII secretion target [Nocardia sp. NBC_00511]|uniref:WXG100 family type VII secretion target n=1 Tax=Nocardia sp. NBC_00511 TaxID=2903591 RepID=UPI0030E56F73
MSDYSYRVDLAHLEQVTARIAALRGFLDDSLAGVDSRIAAAHTNWSGPAADRHAEAHRQWLAAAGEAAEGIEAMRAAAAAAHRNYTDAVATNLRILGR